MLGSGKTLPAVLRASLTWDQREMRDCKQVAVDADIDGRISERLAHSGNDVGPTWRDGRRAAGCTPRSGPLVLGARLARWTECSVVAQQERENG
jgi:hypothetical protein